MKEEEKGGRLNKIISRGGLLAGGKGELKEERSREKEQRGMRGGKKSTKILGTGGWVKYKKKKTRCPRLVIVR